MKAIVLFSGGLDSTLAARIVQGLGVEPLALNFLTPFCRYDRVRGCTVVARRLAEALGIGLETVYLGEEYLEIVRHPRHGYGKNLNPCIDCKILMLARARGIMEGRGASFVVTGEVLGQRPMSQHRAALTVIERESGLERLLLRPLSAKLLPPTIPEEKGWIRRDALYGIRGRMRREQLALAAEFGITGYASPAGGCLLTDPAYCVRLRDLMDRGPFTVGDAELLKVGRHFRKDAAKLAVGRNERENEQILGMAAGEDKILEPKTLPGPAGLCRGAVSADVLDFFCRVIARYTRPEGGPVEIEVRTPSGEVLECRTASRPEETQVDEFRVEKRGACREGE